MKYQRATESAQKEQSKIPSSLRPTLLNHVAVHPILKLQRTIGNQAVLNLQGSQNTYIDTSKQASSELRFGHDFSQVRVHTDDTAAEAARILHANAFTAGSHIVFREGQFAPDTSNGRRLLAHELTHVVQQTATGLHTTGLIQRDQATEEKVKRVISPNVQMREGAAKEVEEKSEYPDLIFKRLP